MFLFGEFYFNATLLAPPGTCVVSHTKPAIRALWQPSGEEGWYTGPSMKHYYCVNIYFPITRAVRDVDTGDYFPTIVPFPELKIEDFLRQDATDTVTILKNPTSTVFPALTT